MNIRPDPKSFEFHRKSHDEFSDSGIRSKGSKVPPCIKLQFSLLHISNTLTSFHEGHSAVSASQNIAQGAGQDTWGISLCLTFRTKNKKHLEAFGAPQKCALGWKQFCKTIWSSQWEPEGLCWAWSVLQAPGLWEEHPAWRSPGCAKLFHRMSQGPLL